MKAVIVIDVQNDYCHPNGGIAKFLSVSGISEKVKEMDNFLNVMRAKKVPIIHIQMTEDRNLVHPAVKRMREKSFGSPEEWEVAVPGTWGYELMLDTKNEPIFKKNTFDAFGNPELQKYLERLDVKELIIIGGYTNVCVDTTVRSAVTKGFDVTIVKDLVVAPNELQAAHEGALANLGIHFADVVESKDLIE